jgi:SAM-dependent methyltransferase
VTDGQLTAIDRGGTPRACEKRRDRDGVEALPFDDGSFDAALSVFGPIFAGDAGRAFDEMIRVLRPSGCAPKVS